MGNVMLFAGKDAPDEFVKNLVTRGYDVAVAASPNTTPSANSAEHIAYLKWNKTSPVSARAMILETENSFGAFNTAVLYFDAPIFASQFTTCTVEDVSRAIDSLVIGFQYLAIEIFSRYEQKKINGKLVFLLKTQPSLVETMRTPQRNNISMPSSPIVAAAQSAFGAFAENFAAASLEQEYGSVLLAIGNTQNEISTRDSALANWLCEYLDSISGKEKNSKQAPIWVRAGAKNSGFLSRFLQN